MTCHLFSHSVIFFCLGCLKILFKAELSNIEWKIFFLAQHCRPTFKFSFGIVFTKNSRIYLWKVKSNPVRLIFWTLLFQWSCKWTGTFAKIIQMTSGESKGFVPLGKMIQTLIFYQKLRITIMFLSLIAFLKPSSCLSWIVLLVFLLLLWSVLSSE